MIRDWFGICTIYFEMCINLIVVQNLYFYCVWGDFFELSLKTNDYDDEFVFLE